MSFSLSDLGATEVPFDLSDLGAELAPDDPKPLSDQTVRDFSTVDAPAPKPTRFEDLSPEVQEQARQTVGLSQLEFAGSNVNPTNFEAAKEGLRSSMTPAERFAHLPLDAALSPEAQNGPGLLTSEEAPDLSFLNRSILPTGMTGGMIPTWDESVVPNPQTTAQAIGSGAYEGLRGVLTGGNAVLAAAIPELPPPARAAISAYFAGSLTHDAAAQLGEASVLPSGPLRTQAITKALVAGGMGALAAMHVGSELSSAITEKTAAPQVQVEPDLGIVKTPDAVLKIDQGVPRPLTSVEEQSAAALKGPEAVAPLPVATSPEPPTFENPAKLQALKEDLLASSPQGPNEQVKPLVAAIDERLGQLGSAPKEEPVAEAPKPSEAPAPSDIPPHIQKLARSPTISQGDLETELGYYDEGERSDLQKSLDSKDNDPGTLAADLKDKFGPRISSDKDAYVSNGPTTMQEEDFTGSTPPPETPTGTAPSLEPEPEPFQTSIKNAVTDQERAARGVEPADSVVRRSFPEVRQDALDRLSRDTDAGKSLVEELNAQPRAITDTEDALLLKRQVEVQNEHNAALQDYADSVDAGDVKGQFAAKARIQASRDELQEIYRADRNAGTETARGLNARKMVANQNFEFGRLLDKAEAAKGEPLTESEKDNLQEKARQVKETEAEVAKQEQRSRKQNADSAVQDQIKEHAKEVASESKPAKQKAPKPVSGKILSTLHDARDAALERIKERRGKVMSNPLAPLAHVADEAIVGASHLADGIVNFADWSKRMIEDLGDNIRPSLTALFRQSKDYLESQHSVEAIFEKMANRVKDGVPFEDLASYVKRMGKELIRSGITDRDELVKALHDRVRQILPDVSRTEVRDAYSGYGDFRPLSKDEVSVKDRDLKQQLQAQAKIEALQQGRPLEKSGPERPELSDEGRRMNRQVEELKKTAGVQVTDPETQLRTTLQAHERQLSNAIKDITTEIETGERKGKTPSPTNDRIEQLRDILNRLRETRDAIFGKKRLTDEQRLKAATDAANRMADEYDRQVRQEDFARQKGKPKLTSPEYDAAKARQDAAKAQRDEYRKLDDDFKEQQNEKRRVELESQKAELDRRLREGDLSSKPSVGKTEATSALQDLKNERDAMAAKVAELQREAKKLSPLDAAARDNARKLKATQDQIAALDAKLKAGDISTSPKPSSPVSQAVEDARAERDALSRELQRLRNEAKPRATPDERALASAKTRTLNSIADLKDRLARQDFSKPPKRAPIQPDAELAKAKATEADLKRQIQEGFLKMEAKNQPFAYKTMDIAAKFSRSMMLLEPTIFAKLGAATAYRYISRLAEAGPGVALRVLFPKLTERAPYEGAILNPAQEARALAKGVIAGVRDIPRIMATHTDSLDAQFGKNKPELHSFLDWSGSMHAAVKSPLKRTIWESSFIRRMDSYAKRGIDVSDPAMIMRIGTEAYQDAQRALFLQDNRLSTGMNALIRSLESPDKTTGKATGGGKAAAFALKQLFPITKVGTNVAIEGLNYGLGLYAGGWKLAEAYRNDISKLPEEQADQIVRFLKKGLLGSAVMLASFYAPQRVGGYFVQHAPNAPDQPKPGELKVGNTTVPKVLLHTPLMDPANYAATARRVYQRMTGKGYTPAQSAGLSVIAATLGFAKGLPYIGSTLDLERLATPETTGSYLSNFVNSRTIPGVSRYAAKVQDTPNKSFSTFIHPEPTPRKPQDIPQSFEQDVPWLRQRVPRKSAPASKDKTFDVKF